MASFSFSMRSPNANMRYTAGGKNYYANVRVSQASYTYGVKSTESHSRLSRAFYPHRRILGPFSITVDAKGYGEFKRFMTWLSGYTNALLAAQMGDLKGAVMMEVQMPSRNFHRYGILTSGIDDHDQKGSMVFSQELHFQTLKDFNDSGTSLTSTSQVSTFQAPQVNPNSTLAFYPVTVSHYKDTDTKIYNDPGPNWPNPVPGRPVRGGGVGIE